MENTYIRLLIVADKSVEPRKAVFMQALELLKQDYETVDGLTLAFQVEYISFENVPWEDYWGDGKSFGLNRGWIGKEHARIKKQYGFEFTSVIYLVDIANWKAPGFGGWNLGRFFSGMSAQICKAYITERSTYLVFSMEWAHALNEQVYRELGVKLKDVLNVKNWDYEVVHGQHPDYVTFQYRPVFAKIADYLLRTFQKVEARFTGQLQTKVALLTKILDLYRQVIILLGKMEAPLLTRWLPFRSRKIEMPIYDEEIEKEEHNHQ